MSVKRNTGSATLAVLVASGADLTARDDDGRTPWDLAKLHQKSRIVDWIKQRASAT